MSKYNDESKMYEPFEETLQFPEKPDPTAHWSTVWGEAFLKSAEALAKGENGVPFSFGFDTLKFAEMAKESYEKNNQIIKNECIGNV
jgi:hypothetical protein